MNLTDPHGVDPDDARWIIAAVRHGVRLAPDYRHRDLADGGSHHGPDGVTIRRRTESLVIAPGKVAS